VPTQSSMVRASRVMVIELELLADHVVPDP
jgi:hypothetical protein